ncbi:hypothetical protein L484_019488 [Morus notabilis]|uniref:Glutaredoxin domain-containing protein n=1 Tax=Morus notabilis TaxID=981085 RepID=W9R3D4_9ROSA|nr:hypothetical protein L484_019488 [Morus notabilis]
MEIQGLRRCSEDVVQLDLGGPTSASLSIDDEESAEARIQRLISEHPVIIFSRNSCCMCHVMKKLLATIGVHPTVIELDDHEIPFLPTTTTTTADHPSSASAAAVSPPSVFIGGARLLRRRLGGPRRPPPQRPPHPQACRSWRPLIHNQYELRFSLISHHIMDI